MLIYQVGNKILEKLEDLNDDIKTYKSKNCKDLSLASKIQRIAKNILKCGIKTSEYGSYIATIIQSSEDYEEIRLEMKKINLWNDDLEAWHIESISIKFDICE